MSGLQEQAVQMIGVLSGDNVKFLIDFMQRFMIPKSNRIQAGQTEETLSFMEEMEMCYSGEIEGYYNQSHFCK